MERNQKILSIIIILIAVISILVSNGGGLFNSVANYDVDVAELNNELTIDMSNWNYDSENNIYYQLGIVYCTNPVSTEYESLGIYVPGDYFRALENSNGTCTCSVINANIGNYSAVDAPIVMPINTAGYSAQEGPTSYSYSGLDRYLKAGLMRTSQI